MSSLGTLLAALQQLRRAPGPLSSALAPLLLADLEWLGDSALSVRQLATELLNRKLQEDDGWELVEDLNLDAPDAGRDPWLETLLHLLRCNSCSRKPGGAFSDAHVTTVEFLLELTPPLCETPAGQWQELRADDPKVQEDVDSCEAIYGSDAVSRYDDRVEVAVEDLCVVYRFNSKDPMRVEARGLPQATAGQERVANAAYAVLQSFRRGALPLSEAVRIAGEVRRREAVESSTSSSSSLMLATPSSQWLGLRQETASVKLDFFSPKEAAKQAAEVMKKYLEQHTRFKPAGSAESVVNDALAARFAEKLTQMRCDVDGHLVTPSLVFHGAPSQDVLRSICRQGFLMPGDWIEGTPDFLEIKHGNVKGMGVYTSPCLDTAARYSGVLDGMGIGMVLVALAAPGHCWHEKSRMHTQELISNWFFPSAPKVGTEHNGWVWLGDGWHVKTDGKAPVRRPAQEDVAFAPSDALYDGRFHSRRFGAGTKVSEELVLASVDQLLPLLLLPFASRQVSPVVPISVPGLKTNGRRRRALCGSRVYVYDSDPMPEKELLCCKLLDADPEEELWAVHVPMQQGSKSTGRTLNAIFLVDESLATTEFKSQVVDLVGSLSGQLQAVSAAATFNSNGVSQKHSVSFLPCGAFQATFNSRWPPEAPGEALGDLAAAVGYATDHAIGKLVKDTERYLQRLSPWASLRAGQQLESRQGSTAQIVEVLFDKFEPISLEVQWTAGKRQTATKLGTTEADGELFLHAEFPEGVSHEFSVRKLPSQTPADIAAEMHLVVVVLSSFTSKEKGSSLWQRLQTSLQNCNAQLRCSGCRTTTIPLILGGSAGGLRLATSLREGLSTQSPWWMPWYQAENKAQLPQMLERITEDLGGWLKSWDEIEGNQQLTLSVGHRAARLGSGFLETPMGPPSWNVRLQSQGQASEMYGQCVLYQGELPRRDFWMEDEEYRLVTAAPPAISLEQGTVDHCRRSMEIALALEKLAQQLRASSLASLGSGIPGWVTKLRSMAAKVTPPRPDKSTLEALNRLPPGERAATASRLRGLTGGLQRTANAIQDAAELHQAAEQEPSSAAWVRRVSQMKYGVKVLQRSKKNLEPEDQDLWLKQLDALTALKVPVLDQELPSSSITGCTMLQQLQEMQRIAPELRKLCPSEAVYCAGVTGVAVRCRRSDATEVEPWLMVVEHVSLSWVDTASAALALDASYVVRDEAGEVAPDVVVLASEPRDFYHWFVSSEMYKSYLAMVFTRNPLGQVPGQAFALPVILWVKTAELLIGRAPRAAGSMPKEEADWFRQMLRTHLAAMQTVKQITQNRGSMEQLAEALASAEPAAALTEAEGGPQSVCLALAACCFAKTALPTFWGKRGLERASSRTLQRANSQALSGQTEQPVPRLKANWPRRLRRLALVMMAEAVSRACRRLVRSLCTPETEGEVLKKLLWNALGVDESSICQVTPLGEADPPELAKPEGHSDECDVAHVQRRSALLFAPQGKYFQVALTNCTPQGVVGTLMIRMALLQGNLDPSNDESVEKLMNQLWQREISMKAFIEAVLPGDVSPGAVQAALYVQGLRYHSAKQRRGGLAPLSAPEQILRGLAREQRHLAYLEQLRAKLQSQSSGARKAVRSAERQLVLSSFAPAHSGLPKLFNHQEVSDLNAARPASDQLELLPNGLLKHHCCFPSCPQYLQDLRNEKDKLAEASEERGRNAVMAQRRQGLFHHLAPMMWDEAQGKDSYVPMLHAAAHAAAQRGSRKDHFQRSVREQLDKRLVSRANEVLASKWMEDILDQLSVQMCQ